MNSTFPQWSHLTLGMAVSAMWWIFCRIPRQTIIFTLRFCISVANRTLWAVRYVLRPLYHIWFLERECQLCDESFAKFLCWASGMKKEQISTFAQSMSALWWILRNLQKFEKEQISTFSPWPYLTLGMVMSALWWIFCKICFQFE